MPESGSSSSSDDEVSPPLPLGRLCTGCVGPLPGVRLGSVRREGRVGVAAVGVVAEEAEGEWEQKRRRRHRRPHPPQERRVGPG